MLIAPLPLEVLQLLPLPPVQVHAPRLRLAGAGTETGAFVTVLVPWLPTTIV